MFSSLNEFINLNFSLQKPPLIAGDIWYAAGPIAVLMLASLVYSISSKHKKELIIGNYTHVSTENEDSFRRSDDDEISWISASDVLFQEDDDEMVLVTDAKYAEELQMEEALLASMLSSQTTKSHASSSTYKSRSSLSSLLKDNEIQQIICKICLENHESWQMFINSTCSHSFCYECTSKHATTKIQENINTITCPELNCNSALDFNSLRFIIPIKSLLKWDELLCESTILDSQKLYCPFADCSVLLINDDVSITRIDCPVCRRTFCAACRVPWHSEFSCKEFAKLNSKKKWKKGDDDMAVALAKKKKWQKCPSCKYFVEKAEGCVHITCRCKYEFCYNCGAKWSSNHGGCKPRS